MEQVKVVEKRVTSMCEVLQRFPGRPNRLLIRYDGIPVFADLLQNDEWELSDVPASSGEEKAAYDSFTELGTTVTTTDPSGNVTTYKDE